MSKKREKGEGARSPRKSGIKLTRPRQLVLLVTADGVEDYLLKRHQTKRNVVVKYSIHT